MKYYDDLQVPRGASAERIKGAYRKLCKQYHPDKTGGESAGLFHRIQEAYDVLSDPEKRRQYDEIGDAPRSMSEIEKDLCNGFLSAIEAGVADVFGSMRKAINEMMKIKTRERQQILETLHRMTVAGRNIRKKGKASPGQRNPFLEALRAKEDVLKAQAQGKLDDMADLEARLAYLKDWETIQPDYMKETWPEFKVTFG